MSSQDDIARCLVAIENAASDEESAPLVDSLWNDHILKAGAPFRALAPFLAQPNFPAAILERIATRLKAKGAADARAQQASLNPGASAVLLDESGTPLSVLMASLCLYLTAAAAGYTCMDDSSHVVNVITCIAKAPTAMSAAIDTGLFFSRRARIAPGSRVGADSATAAETLAEKVTAPELMSQSVVGALIAMPLLYKNRVPHNPNKLQKLAEAYPYDRNARDLEERKKRSSDMEHAAGLRLHAERINNVLGACLRSGPENRLATFIFINRVIDASTDYMKQQHDEAQLFDRFCLTAFAHALIKLADPIVDHKNTWFPSQLDPMYLFDPSRQFGIVRFASGKEEETVISGSNAPPRPAPATPTTEHYNNKFHIFFMALRAVVVCIRTLKDELTSLTRYVRSAPNMHHSQRAVLAAMCGRNAALLGSWNEGCSDMLRFVDAVAKWLLFVSRVDMATGEVDESKPADAMWAHLPLVIVDTVVDLVHALVVHLEWNEHPPLAQCGFYEIGNVVSLALLLMGNTHLLPKAYTHIAYPDFLLFLMQHHDQGLRNHQWFVTHSLRGCIDCYIVVEACEYDRTQERYHLSHMMERLLMDPAVVDRVRRKYNDTKDQKLERFTKMMTHEVSDALTHLTEGLKDMHELEMKNQNTIPANDPEYRDKMARVRSGNMCAKTALSVFTRLLDQFKEGMAQHLVVQQIGTMLVSFLIKLAGPGSSALKSLSMEECGFRPREMLEQLVQAFTRFYDVPGFTRYCVEATQDMELFYNAVAKVRSQALVPAHLAMALAEMEKSMREAEAAVGMDEEIFNDPPEGYACEIMMQLLENPVFLPGTDTRVEQQIISHQLMDNPTNPFSRAPLTLEELQAYNNTPEIKKRREDLVAEIKAWKAQRRAEHFAKKQAAASQTADAASSSASTSASQQPASSAAKVSQN